MALDPRVSLLIGADTAVVDESSYARALTAVGNAARTTTSPKFGAGCLTFDGAGDWITAPDSEDFNWGFGDFTVEGWFRFLVKQNNQALLGQWGSGGNSWFLYIQSSTLTWTNSGLNFSASFVPVLGQWYHIAIDRQDVSGTATARLYVDGVVLGTSTSHIGLPVTTEKLVIGAIGDVGSFNAFDFQGQMDEIRITKGLAQYAGAFTPPTGPFPRDSGSTAIARISQLPTEIAILSDAPIQVRVSQLPIEVVVTPVAVSAQISQLPIEVAILQVISETVQSVIIVSQEIPMAFGDSGRAQNAIGYQGGLAQNHLNNLRSDTIVPQNQTFWNNYLMDKDTANKDYGGIMGGYKNIAETAGNAYNPAAQGFSALGFGGAGGWDSEFRGGLSSALGGYGDFAKTGGLSGQNIQDMRARSVAPLRAVYANANRDVNRQRSLQGGYSPNLTAAKTKMAREMGQGLSDASTNVEATLAEQIRAGKLAGMAGQTQTSAQGQGLQNAIDSLSANTKLQGLSGLADTTGKGLDSILKALAGGSSLYGTAPGMADMSGRNALTSTGQQIDLAQLQNQLGLGTMNAQIAKGQIPGNVQQGITAAQGISSILKNLSPGIGGAAS